MSDSLTYKFEFNTSGPGQNAPTTCVRLMAEGRGVVLLLPPRLEHISNASMRAPGSDPTLLLNRRVSFAVGQSSTEG